MNKAKEEKIHKIAMSFAKIGWTGEQVKKLDEARIAHGYPSFFDVQVKGDEK